MSKKFKLRRSDVISPWGIGSIVPFPNNESFIVAGFDQWFNEIEGDRDKKINEFEILDKRFSRYLSGARFISPPIVQNDKNQYFQKKTQDYNIPAFRFPLWHYCPVCGIMVKLGENANLRSCDGARFNGKETYCSSQREKNPKKKLSLLVPERFVAVCENGHLQDVPLKEWVHQKSGKELKNDCVLRRSTGGINSSLAGVYYKCSCGASQSLQGIFNKDALENIGEKCCGNRPWFGSKNSNETCDKPLQVVQKGSSNVWFPRIESSIFIPEANDLKQELNFRERECVEQCVKKLSSYRSNGEIDFKALARIISKFADLYEDEIDPEKCREEVLKQIHPAKNIEETEKAQIDYRHSEYNILIKTSGDTNSELYCISYPSNTYKNLNFLKSVGLIHKLRETRAFISFSRLLPTAQQQQISILKKNKKMLPAVENHGEGIMLEFNLDKLNKWILNDEVLKRTELMQKNIEDFDKDRVYGKINPTFLLLHTFAHALINALASECGYNASSIREKIYCQKYVKNHNDSVDMAGILIYTTASGTDGSLGGLVREGKTGRLENIIQRAIFDSEWCSADPVCIQSDGQGFGNSNLAACHNCVLLPETSCEERNMLLDRGMLVGELNNKTFAFFKEYLEDEN